MHIAVLARRGVSRLAIDLESYRSKLRSSWDIQVARNRATRGPARDSQTEGEFGGFFRCDCQADLTVPWILGLLGQFESGSIVHLHRRLAGDIQIDIDLLPAARVCQSAYLWNDSCEIGRAAGKADPCGPAAAVFAGQRILIEELVA